ncbi:MULTISPECIES: DUF2280 domain-containing protein [Acinetobacter]|uniref:DUF2280 domain-containing protein n=1 Tax=Acinetobacter TaxID=469 RepID=UPI00046DA01D|nr:MULTISPECIES: DUF2280 domain-containing protein [Acinetobacter]RSP35908.1 DUF2280 domain-containing protein [Acinetobacter baumannii]RTE46598.1 DUF2280 domain-containing protein [Acinetobacter junii]
MARITKKVKLFIVRMLAEFETPTQTSRSVKEVFSIDVTPQQCEAYDPTKRIGQDLSQELRDKFFEYRRIANQELEAIPIANMRYRLQLLQGLVDKYPDNPVLIPKWAEQAAKEMGGLYTNTSKTQLTGADGQPLNPEHVTHVVATPEQVRQALDELESKY